MRPRKFLSLVVVSAIAIGACSGGDADSTTSDPSSVPTEVTDGNEYVAPEVPAAPEIPDAYVVVVVDDVTARTGLATAEIFVVQATAVEWASQRLGCVQLDEPSEPTPVDGFRVVVNAGGFEFDYRLDAAGDFQLCGDPFDTEPEGPDDGDDHDDTDNLDEETS